MAEALKEKKRVRELLKTAEREALKKKLCEIKARLAGLKEGTMEYEIYVINCIESE